MNSLITCWFRKRGWKPFDFQRHAVAAYKEGCDGLIHAPAGLGKTLAAWLPPVSRWLDEHPALWPKSTLPLQVIWLTPLRAFAVDTVRALQEFVDELKIPWPAEDRPAPNRRSARATGNRAPSDSAA